MGPPPKFKFRVPVGTIVQFCEFNFIFRHYWPGTILLQVAVHVLSKHASIV